jgi:hypothetical protein
LKTWSIGPICGPLLFDDPNDGGCHLIVAEAAASFEAGDEERSFVSGVGAIVEVWFGGMASI